MKEKIENKQKKPWYVRVSDYYEEKYEHIKRIAIIIPILAYILGSVISYGVLKNKPMTPYEEKYDVEFINYVNEKLENIASKITIGEKTGIRVFTYYLDKEQTISDYYSETGKEPILSYIDSEEEFGMKIELSEDFEVLSKEPLLQIPETRDEYEHLYTRRILPDAFILCGLLVVAAILVFYLVFMLLILWPVYAFAGLWKLKHKIDSKE